jgi:hypothetical protein
MPSGVEAAADAVAIDRDVAGCDHLATLVEGGQQHGQVFGKPAVVVIHVSDELAPGAFQGEVARAAGMAVPGR